MTINEQNAHEILSVLEDELEFDNNWIVRQDVKEYYLGRYTQGESTKNIH